MQETVRAAEEMMRARPQHTAGDPRPVALPASPCHFFFPLHCGLWDTTATPAALRKPSWEGLVRQMRRDEGVRGMDRQQRAWEGKWPVVGHITLAPLGEGRAFVQSFHSPQKSALPHPVLKGAKRNQVRIPTLPWPSFPRASLPLCPIWNGFFLAVMGILSLSS